MQTRSKSRNNGRIERNNDVNDIDMLSKKKKRDGELIKNQESVKVEDNNINNISVTIEDNKKEENEDDKNEDDKKDDDKIEDDKKEDDKIEDNKGNDIKKRCCLRCVNNQGCCICLNKQYKCGSCLYFDYLRKREQRIENETKPSEKKIFPPQYPLFPSDPYQDIELRSFHSVERENSIIPENRPENSLIIDNQRPFLENGRKKKKRSPMNIILCVLYMMCLIYLTIVFRNANGFYYRATTSLYVMIIGLFVMFFMKSLQNYFK